MSRNPTPKEYALYGALLRSICDGPPSRELGATEVNGQTPGKRDKFIDISNALAKCGGCKTCRSKRCRDEREILLAPYREEVAKQLYATMTEG